MEKQQMAQEKKTTRAPKVAEAFDVLTKLVEAQEASKGQAKPVSDFVSLLTNLTTKTEKADDASKMALVEALPADALGFATDTLDRVSLLASFLAGSAEDVDREAGDLKVSALRAMIAADILEDDDVEPAQALITRWEASAPTKSRRSGSGSAKEIPALGFTVKVSCQHEGCAWGASTNQDNLNSVRWQASKHVKSHGRDLTKGNPSFIGLTEALAKVGMTTKGIDAGEASAAEGGGFTVTRAA